MSLIYKILWIDDSPEWVDSVRTGIEEHMRTEKLKPVIEHKESGDDIERQIEVDSIDLLIVDWNLGDRNGDDIIKAVLACGGLSQIVLYSNDTNNHGKLAGYDGINCIDRYDARESIEHAISEFSTRSKNIAVMRGVIIAEAIDVENKLTEVLRKLFHGSKALFQAKILDKRRLDFTAKHNIVLSCLKDKIKETGGKNHKDPKLRELESLEKIMKKMQEEVIDQRNILAHSEKKLEGGYLVLNGLNKTTKKIIFDDNWKNKIRSDMKKHRENLQKLHEIF